MLWNCFILNVDELIITTFVCCVASSVTIIKLMIMIYLRQEGLSFTKEISKPGGGGTLRISGCGCAARTLEPLAYTRASFSWILLPYTRVNS